MVETVGKICVLDKEKRDSLSYYWNNERKELLKQHYPSASWDMLLSLFPEMTKAQITHKASRLKIPRSSSFWSDDDLRILESGYANGLSSREIATMLGGRYSESSICTRANKLGLRKRVAWSDAEKSLLMQVYEVVDTESLTTLFPDRELRTIQEMGRKLGLHSNTFLQRSWTQNEDAFLEDHWEMMTDSEMSGVLGRTVRAVKWRREKLGLIREIPKGTYEYLRNYLWKENRAWRIASIEACGYKCIVTGGRFTDVHHLYGSNLIVSQALHDLGLEYAKVADYTQQELEQIACRYAELNAQYPLGVCLSAEIHAQFHQEYGYGNNTPEQFYDFIEKHYPDTQIPVTITAA